MCHDKEELLNGNRHRAGLPFEEPPPVRLVNKLSERNVKIEAGKRRYESDEVIRFEIPPLGLLEPRSTRLAVTISVRIKTLPAGRSLQLPLDFRTIFTRARLLLGRTTILQDINEYGMLCKLVTLMYSDVSDYFSSDSTLRGIQTESGLTNLLPGTRSRLNYHNYEFKSVSGVDQFGVVPRRYMGELNLGLFNQASYIPLHLLKQPLILELTIGKMLEIIYFNTSAGDTPITGGEIVVTNPELQLTFQSSSFMENQEWAALMASRKLKYHYISWDHRQFPLNVNLARHRLVIPTFRRRLKYALAILRSGNDLENTVSDSTNTYLSLDPRTGNTGSGGTTYYESTIAVRTALKSYQWSLGNQFVSPDRPVKVVEIDRLPYDDKTNPEMGYTGQATEAFYHLLRVIGKTNGSLSYNQEFPWGYHETGVSGDIADRDTPIFSNKLNVTTTYNSGVPATNELRAYTSFFVMAGKFFNETADGAVEYLDGKGNNDKLVLNLEFNNGYVANSFNTTTWKPYCDVFVAYDTRLEISDTGDIMLDA